MNLKRMTDEQLWHEYGRHIGFSALLKKEIERRIRFRPRLKAVRKRRKGRVNNSF